MSNAAASPASAAPAERPAPSPDADTPAWVVLKFGGTSVSTAARWATIADVVRAQVERGARPLLVCSALSGISDALDAFLASEAAAAAAAEAVRERHRALARALGLDADALLADAFAALDAHADALASGAYAASPAANGRGPGLAPARRAEVMALGELMSTRLGAAYLSAEGLPTRWVDARKLLTAQDAAHVPPARRYLAATCAAYPDVVLQDHLAAKMDADAQAVALTQGFIAATSLGETVLLGRGGSDTSAAYLAAKLGADRLEIWTDVPGLFTANPRQIPSARLLRQVGYAEAQELATMGAKVLHPRCLGPVRRHGIPLAVRSTDAPHLDGTLVTAEAPDRGPEVQAISAKAGVTVVTMDTLGMWQQVGFLADVFAIFKHHGLSVDLVATSEANVTVTLDPLANALDAETTDSLLRDLNRVCRAQVIAPCAVVSLVGRHLRALLSQLGGAFEVFEGVPLHLVSQAASDLNFSVVVDEDEAPKLVRKLHATLFDTRPEDDLFGPRWNELFGQAPTAASGSAPWWHARRDDLLALAEEATPHYAYHAATLHRRAAGLAALEPVDRAFYAIKANPHPEVLRVIRDAGLGFECVSPGEVARVRETFPDLDPSAILFQPNFAAIDDYADAFAAGLRVTLDSLHPLAHHPDVFAGQRFNVRVDPGRGHGHHRHVRTAGAQSKFGVVPDELGRLRALADRVGAEVVGLHAHVGSGITEAATWGAVATFLAACAADFPGVEAINVGGGLGVPVQPEAPGLDLEALAEVLAEVRRRHPRYALWMEPGRYVVAEAGVLLARVTQTKTKGPVRYVGLDAGMHVLLRPALYGAYHPIANLSRLDAPLAVTAEVVGPICESGDVLGHSRRLPETEEGDVLVIGTVGAYGAAMQMGYNLRDAARETLLR